MRRTTRFLALPLAAALALGACSSDDDSGNSTATTAAPGNQGTAGPSTSAPPATDELPAGTVEVTTATTDLGEILVNGAGRTLYTNTADTGGVPACVDACAQAWPPLVGTAVQAGSSVAESDLTLVERPDGTMQVAWQGKPLYLFSGDTAAGETTGEGLNDQWFVVVLAE